MLCCIVVPVVLGGFWGAFGLWVIVFEIREREKQMVANDYERRMKKVEAKKWQVEESWLVLAIFFHLYAMNHNKV